jgi:membrane protease YdiL (CAAX protease family)
MKKLITAIIIAAALWCVMFSPWTAPHLNFWIAMTCSALVLIAMGVILTPHFASRWKFSLGEVLIGIGSAALLWGIFWVGDKLSTLMFDFARPQVGMIYGLKSSFNPWIIGVLLMFIIGPAEEIFWRGTVQRLFTERLGWIAAFFIATAIYALVHIWSLNFMLIAAAAVCGGFWALLYAWRKNLTAVVISHCLWDVAVFLVFPIM